MVEHRTENSGVEGSIPSIGTQSAAFMLTLSEFKFLQAHLFLINMQNKLLFKYYKTSAALMRTTITYMQSGSPFCQTVVNSNLVFRDLTQFSFPSQKFTYFVPAKRKQLKFLLKKTKKKLLKKFAAKAQPFHFSIKFRKMKLFRWGYKIRKRLQYKYLNPLKTPVYHIRRKKQHSYLYDTIYANKLFPYAQPNIVKTLNIKAFELYLSQITKNFLGFKTSWLFLDPTNSLKTKRHITVFKQLYTKKQLNGLYTVPKMFLLWYIKLILFKDPYHLSLLIYFWLYKADIKTHKRIFLFIVKFFSRLYVLLRGQKKILGCFIYFKGKLGKKGSVRKEKIFSKHGKVAHGTKSLRGSINWYQIPTLTGAIGSAVGFFFLKYAHIKLIIRFLLLFNAPGYFFLFARIHNLAKC